MSFIFEDEEHKIQKKHREYQRKLKIMNKNMFVLT